MLARPRGREHTHTPEVGVQAGVALLGPVWQFVSEVTSTYPATAIHTQECIARVYRIAFTTA